MKGVDLSNYALEDLLSFDDVFLDYFNNFLKNPAFPQPLQYNRFLGVFEEIVPSQTSIVFTDRLPKRLSSLSNMGEYGNSFNSNEAEQNKVFDWVRKERLPLFFRTNVFREFKLCKLLVRPLDEEKTDSANSSQHIGGYSRQTSQTSNTLSTDDPEDRFTAGAAADNDHSFSPNIYGDLDKLNKYLFQRPGSRAFSVPAYFPFFSFNKLLPQTKNNDTKAKAKRPPTVSVESSSKESKDSNNLALKANGGLTDLKRQGNFEDLTKIEQKLQLEKKILTKALSKEIAEHSKQNKSNGKINGNGNGNGTRYTSTKASDHKDKAHEYDFDFEYDNEDDDDDDDDYSDENDDLPKIDHLSIDDDVIDDLIESDKIYATINQYKLKYLGSVYGMSQFKEFLRTTSGGDRFIKYWLDCEFFRDSMQDYDQIENMATRNRLFRDINEKYIFPFADKVNSKIRNNYFEQSGLSHDVFIRIQYDILRRLRSYWVPRYILHCLRNSGKNYGSFPLPPLTPEYSRQSTYNTVPSTAKCDSANGKKKIDNENLTKLQRETLYTKVRQALNVDKEAGGPFLRFISIHYPDHLPLVLFWYDVIDFSESEINGCDKNSRLQHAWAIYNSYLSPTARFNIGLSSEFTNNIRKELQENQTQSVTSAENINSTGIDIKIFQPIIQQLIPYLEMPWLEYLKDDVMKYTEAKLAFLELSRTEGEGDDKQENSDLPAPDIEIIDDKIFINRPWILKLLLGKSTDRDSSLPKKRVEMTEERKAELKRRRKIMEIERRKAMKAMRLRKKQKNRPPTEEIFEITNDENKLKNRLLKKGDLTENDSNNSRNEKANSRGASTFQSEKSVFFDKMMATNKSMTQLLRKYLVDNNQRDALNKFNIYVDARAYLDLNAPSDVHKKINASIAIQKTYLDPNSKKNILPLSEKLQLKLQADLHAEQRGNGRPRTPFMNAVTREYRSVLEDEYQKFCELQANELGLLAPEDFAMLSQSELLVLLGDSYNAKDFDFDEEKGEGKQMPSKEDRAEFLRLLNDWSMGRFDMRFYAYYAHLTEHGKKDGLPFLDKDLLFCIDTIRLKDINGEEVLKQKCQMLLEVYLDSQLPPAIQVDINHETHQKLIKALARIMQLTSTLQDFSDFDGARAMLFKDLLPYWSGFKHTYKILTERPLTKMEKALKERLDEFKNSKQPDASDFKLPPISGRLRGQPTLHNPNSSLQIVFSLTNGIKYKDEKHHTETKLVNSNGNQPEQTVNNS